MRKKKKGKGDEGDEEELEEIDSYVISLVFTNNLLFFSPIELLRRN